MGEAAFNSWTSGADPHPLWAYLLVLGLLWLAIWLESLLKK